MHNSVSIRPQFSFRNPLRCVNSDVGGLRNWSPGNLIPYGLELFQRDLEPNARGVLRRDTPDSWVPDTPAIRNLAYGSILHAGQFDDLPEDNKFIVVALVRHVVDVLNSRYIRKEPFEHLDMSRVTIGSDLRNYPILYLSTEATWDEYLRLASAPGARELLTSPAAGEVSDFLKNEQHRGSIVSAELLEECLERARNYYEDVTQSASRRPTLDMDNLDKDDMHAFLCAYATCFRQRENSVQQPIERPWWSRLFDRWFGAR